MASLIKLSNFSGIVSTKRVPPAERTRHDIRAFFIFFLGGSVIWILVLSIASSRHGESFLTTLGTLGMFSAAGMMVGGVFGFLFGIPRVLASSAAATAQNAAPDSVQPKTNLEQISDWLTKVLVGVGLTQVNSIYTAVGNLSNSLAGLFAGKPLDGPIAVTTLITFSLSGFLWAYFESRTSLLLLFGDPSGVNVALTAEATTNTIAEMTTVTGSVPGTLTGTTANKSPTPQK